MRPSNHTNADHIFLFLGGKFCLQVLRQAGPPQRVDCLTSTENERKVSFPRTQRRIVSLGIEPSDLSRLAPLVAMLT